MDGVHDLGGLAGFGPVEPEADEPTFHEDWERRVFRLNTAAGAAGIVRSGGAFRHSIERMEPAHYLNSSYYEHWLTGIATLAVEDGLVSRAELDERAGGRFPLSGVDRGAAPEAGAADQTVPRFEIGHEVRVRAWHPAGHTRAPRYVQGKHGVVVRHDGAFSVPDVEAHSDRRRREPTYSVRFTAEELWGEGGAPGEVVHVDLWESYLEREDGAGRGPPATATPIILSLWPRSRHGSPRWRRS
jgi:nitrile hydratase beta subunit